MRTTVISAQNPGQADESLNLPALVEHILEGAKLWLASWKSLTIAEIDLSLDRGVPRSLESMPQAVSKKTSLSLKCAPPEAVERGSNSFHATTSEVERLLEPFDIAEERESYLRSFADFHRCGALRE